MNDPDSAQAVAAFQFNKHFLRAHSQQCSRWAMVLRQLGVGRKQGAGGARLRGRHGSWRQGPDQG